MTRADLCDLVMAVDPAGTRKTQASKFTGARMATAIVGQDIRRNLFCCASWADRLDTEGFINHLLDSYLTWTPRWVGIEANAMQGLFGDSLVLIARDRGITLPYVPLYPKTNVDKLWRIRQAIQLPLAQGRLFVQSDQEILLQELKDFPHGVTVDAVDALAWAIEMLPARPAPAAIDLARTNLADALRAQGVAPHVIAQRLTQYDRDIGRDPGVAPDARPW